MPVALSFVVANAARSFDLARNANFWWWFCRLAQYWLGLLLCALLFVITYLAGLLLIRIAAGELEGWDSHIQVALAAIIFSIFVYRLWPLAAAALLLEGKIFYKNPLYRYMLWPEGPAWLGPGILDAWRWTSHPKAKGDYSTKVVVASTLSAALLILGYELYYLSPIAGAALIFLTFLFVVSPLIVYCTAATWLLLLYSGESPLVIATDRLPIPNDLEMTQQKEQAARTFINRFPEGFGTTRRYIFETRIIETSREEILAEIKELGSYSSRYEGTYIELWANLADRKNELMPELIADLQGAVLLLCVPDDDSPLAREFDHLVIRWNHRFPVIGPEL